ncbi:ribonuclease P protein component [Blattabacterium sp. (Cryptocercus punctulatus) str. Cpu]|uniref:ribonuclease P protein component n=1 Tax=Blattabacterium sp. (Cryptocercus punctulatus) str. Cpu TaxID=1075399 RepID=UPI000238718F|nr:ribonuclease P protein component [Blattabacterium sp. (Cryptocercus punctulatus) str. Cpu]AEU09518.1 ribonuclease P protein component [Blattabacterium sp. (Cryptocercus punctulatus) str. Cpu]
MKVQLKIKRSTNIINTIKYGKSLFFFPIYTYVLLYSNKRYPEGIKLIGTLVKKKNFKKSVHRNKIKRLLRSSFLCNKSILEEKKDKYKSYHIVFFIKELFYQISKKLINLLKKYFMK